MTAAAQTDVSGYRDGAGVEPRDLLVCRGLRVGRDVAILPPIDVTLRAGEFWSVIGRNGSGKTTWFKTILGLLRPIAGTVVRPDASVRVSYIAQRASLDETFPLRARDVVRLAADRGWSFARPRWSEPASVSAALEEVGAADLGDRPFRALSEGQKQRVLMAQLLVSRAELALLDEPTAAMDVVAEREAFVLLDALRRRHGMTVVVVSHWLDVARGFADRAILLDRENGSVVVGTPADVLAHPVFRASYGVGVGG